MRRRHRHHITLLSVSMAHLKRFLVVFLAIGLLAYCVKRPLYNWDMIGYVASAHARNGLSGAQLSERTYADVKQSVPTDVFVELVTGPYRSAVYADPKSLEQQVPFYSIRVLYVELIRALGSWGVSPVRSSHVLSAIFAALSVFPVAGILARSGVTFLALPVVVAASGLLELGRLSTPDALTTFCALTSVHFLLAGRMKAAGLIFACLPLLRTDFVILSSALAYYCWYHGERRLATTSAFLALFLYVVVVQASGGYGWQTVFNFTFIQASPYPADMQPSFEWRSYANIYTTFDQAIFQHAHWILYALALIPAFGDLLKNRMTKQDLLMYWVPVFFVFVHLLFFPAYMQRFFVFSAAIVCCWLFARLVAPPHAPLEVRAG